MECIFCKVVSGERPCMKVYEDEHTMVFMSKHKDVDGHMIAMTKKHVENIMDCDEDTLAKLMNTVKKVSNHCVDNCGFSGINLIGTNGKSADQTVPHFHLHIVPRKENDGVEAWPNLCGAKDEIETVYEQIKMI